MCTFVRVCTCIYHRLSRFKIAAALIFPRYSPHFFPKHCGKFRNGKRAHVHAHTQTQNIYFLIIREETVRSHRTSAIRRTANAPLKSSFHGILLSYFFALHTANNKNSDRFGSYQKRSISCRTALFFSTSRKEAVEMFFC